MSSLIYSPGIRVFISTSTKGIVEVSDDISQGTLDLGLVREGGHSLSITLTNQARKYDGIFTPNDRVVVFMKRIRWLQVFSGYLDSVPTFTAYARPVTLTATCAVAKRLLYALYDAGSQEFATLMNSSTTADVSIDSNLSVKAMDVLTQVAGWPREKIHIGGIPEEWFQSVASLYDTILPGLNLGAPQIAGSSPLARGRGTKIPSSIPATGTLPASVGRVGAIGDLGNPIPDTFDITGERTDTAQDQWYCAMRWPYRVEGSTNPADAGLTADQVAAAKSWWRDQRIMVMNPRTQKTIIVRPALWGPPAASTRSMDLSTTGLEELGLRSGEFAYFAFAPIVASSSQGVAYAPLGVYYAPSSTAPPVTSTGSNPIAEDPFGTSNNPFLNPATTTPNTVMGDAGITFASEDNLKPNVVAARTFIQKLWPQVPNIGGYATTGHATNSDHYTGLALDVSTGNGSNEPNVDQVALGNSIAFWFTQNPLVFGIKYVIWNNMWYDSRGAAPYEQGTATGQDISLGHRNHVHISFNDTGQTSMGSVGNAWPVSTTDFMRTAALGGVVNADRAASITLPSTTGVISSTGNTQLITATWTQQGQDMSTLLTGARQLLNDVPVRGLVDQIMGAAQRDYCTAPNGDLIAWWPDYFNLYGTCGRLVLQSIELADFAVQWNDRNFVTHQFVTGAIDLGSFGAAGVGNAPVYTADQAFAIRQLGTHGIASIDFPELLRTVLNIEPGTAWADPTSIYQRFGARVNAKQVDWIASPEVEFWYAVSLFRQAWGAQFSTAVPMSFMPELFPGMILQIPEYGVQMYVDKVSHSFSLGKDGSGFATRALAMAPSTIGSQPRLIGLPKGGQWIGSQGTAGPPAPAATGG